MVIIIIIIIIIIITIIIIAKVYDIAAEHINPFFTVSSYLSTFCTKNVALHPHKPFLLKAQL